MTETLHATVPSRPIRSVMMQQRGAALGGLIATIGFFLPWEESWLNFGPSMGGSSGFSFAQTTESVASGNSLAILWVVLIAAVLILGAGLYAAFLRLDARSYKGVCGIQAVLGVAGIAIIWMTVPGEIDTWSGLVVEYQFGIWVTTVGLGIGAIAALLGLANKELDSA